MIHWPQVQFSYSQKANFFFQCLLYCINVQIKTIHSFMRNSSHANVFTTNKTFTLLILDHLKCPLLKLYVKGKKNWKTFSHSMTVFNTFKIIWTKYQCNLQAFPLIGLQHIRPNSHKIYFHKISENNCSQFFLWSRMVIIFFSS